jgi:flavocytochrome c
MTFNFGVDSAMLREAGGLPTGTDVLILGAGIAGLCAALSAAEAGADVLLLEKTAHVGGSSAMAGGGFAFSGTDLQQEAGVPDSPEAFRQDLLKSGRNLSNPALVNAFIENQLETYNFLREHRVKFQLSPGLPGAVRRAHGTGTGTAVTALHMEVLANHRIKFFSKSAGQRLRRSPGIRRVDVAYVLFGDREVEIDVAGGVVLATGGFSRSAELLQAFAPELTASLKHGGVGNTGDGLIMAADLGAGLADLGFVSGSLGAAICNYPNAAKRSDEVAPFLFSFLIGGILVNKHGLRFAKEDQGYKALGTLGMEQPEGICFQIFDQKLKEKSGRSDSVNNFEEGLIGGYIQRADVIGDLAVKMGIDPSSLEATITRYNMDARAGIDAQYGRKAALTPLDTPPYYIAATANAVTSTYGGIAVNGDMAVVDWFGERIEGLFAAGEVVGGFHGAGFYSASSLSSSATFGRLAGKIAAAAVSPRKHALNH